MILIPSIIFICLFLTNDFHQLCFAFNDSNDYFHGIIYYIALIYLGFLSLASLLILYFKCNVSAVRKKIWIPVSLFVISFVFFIILFFFNFDSVKVPDAICIVVTVLIESLIAIGFIPSNSIYKSCFSLSNTNAIIVDDDKRIFVAAQNASETMKEIISKSNIDEYITIDQVKYRKKGIHGGNVYWAEDLTNINYLNQEICETNENLLGENDLLLAENKLKEEQISLAEQQKLYKLVEKVTKKQCKEIDRLIETAYGNEELNLKLACIYAAYVKRRSNLVILHQDSNQIHIDELLFSMKESLSYLTLYGVLCSLKCLIQDKYYQAEQMELMYDFFEENIEEALPSLNAIFITISEQDYKLKMRICLAGKKKMISKEWQKDVINNLNGTIEVFDKMDDENYALLSLEVK